MKIVASSKWISNVVQFLLQEKNIFDCLIYRNRNQHGRTKYWKRLEELMGLLKSLHIQELETLIFSIKQDIIKNVIKRGERAVATITLSRKCHALGLIVQQCCTITDTSIKCSEFLIQEIAQGYFLNLMVILLAMLGRIRSLMVYLAKAIFSLYKTLQSELPPSLRDNQTQSSGVQAIFEACILSKECQISCSSKEEEYSLQSDEAKAGSSRQQRDNEDDMGVLVEDFTSKVVPLPGQGHEGRALLATEYSSTEEEEEDEEGPGKPKPQKTLGGGGNNPPLSLPTSSSCEPAVDFVIDRAPLGRDGSRHGAGSRKKIKRDQPAALDEIDLIFQQGSERRKKSVHHKRKQSVK